MATPPTKDRRRFLKTLWGSALYFGSGMLAFPIGSCSTKREALGPLDLTADQLDALPDLSPDEIEVFLQDVREAQADRMAQDATEATDAPVDQQTVDSSEVQEILDSTSDLGPKPKLPPGQTAFDVIPVLGSNSSPRTQDTWTFYVKGEVDQELSFTWQQFQDLKQTDQICDIHCVTSWSVLDVSFGGVRVKDLLALAGLKTTGKFVIFDCEQGYTTNIPVAEALKDNVLIATRLFGEPLPQKYGGPARGLVPDLYYYKSGKWVMGIRVLDHDEPGYWEVRGYSNSADPWKEERFS